MSDASSKLSKRIVNYACNVQRSSVEIKAPTHWNLIGRSMTDGPAACVIAQQYSSKICLSLRVHSRKEKFRHVTKYYFSLEILQFGISLRWGQYLQKFVMPRTAGCLVLSGTFQLLFFCSCYLKRWAGFMCMEIQCCVVNT